MSFKPDVLLGLFGQDQGPKRVVDIGFLISKGVNVYMGRTIPVVHALAEPSESIEILLQFCHECFLSLRFWPSFSLAAGTFHPQRGAIAIADTLTRGTEMLVSRSGIEQPAHRQGFTTAGPRAVACFAVGAVLNLISVMSLVLSVGS